MGADKNLGWLTILVVLFMALGAAPFGVAAQAAWRGGMPRWGEALMLAATVVALGFSLYAYLTFAVRTTFDAQDGLIFAVVPAYELIGIMGVRSVIGMAVR